MNDLIPKPIEPRELSRVMRRWVSSHPQAAATDRVTGAVAPPSRPRRRPRMASVSCAPCSVSSRTTTSPRRISTAPCRAPQPAHTTPSSVGCWNGSTTSGQAPCLRACCRRPSRHAAAMGERLQVQRRASTGRSTRPCLVLSNSLGVVARHVDAAGRRVRTTLPRAALRHARARAQRRRRPARTRSSCSRRTCSHLLDAAGIERVSFCGLSMGGATGIWLAGARAGALRALRVLQHGAVARARPDRCWRARPPCGARGSAASSMRRWSAGSRPSSATREPQTVAAIRASFLATPPEGYAACCDALAGFDERDTLAAIERPVLVVAGLHDPAPPIAAARDYASRIAGARIVELPAAHLSNLGARAAVQRGSAGVPG